LFLDEIDPWLRQNAEFLTGPKTLRECSLSGQKPLWKKLIGKRISLEERRHFFESLVSTLIRRKEKLVVLDTHGVAVANKHVRVGDVVCRLKGFNVPVILRSNNEVDYVIVGSAFVSAPRSSLEDGLPLKSFLLGD